jgi:hypothetical protein
MEDGKPLEGVIAFLTKKHGGHVNETGCVTITSKSHERYWPPKTVADLTNSSCFISQNGPCQWIQWDFHEKWICLTAYPLYTADAKAWVLEGSLDGENWTVIDRQKGRTDPRGFGGVFARRETDRSL